MNTIKNTDTRYGLVAMALHWAMAVLILYMAWLGLGLEDFTEGSVAQLEQLRLHQSIGITLLLLAFARLGWRLAGKAPAALLSLTELQQKLATAMHWLFYGFMIGAPLAGWTTASLSPNAEVINLYGVLPWPMIPGVPELASKANEHLAHEVHEIIVFAMLGLLVLHIGAALWHHFRLKDDGLKRMLPGA